MFLNLSNPDSIVAWWTVMPDRHGDYLTYKLKTSPEFAPSINEALRRIAASPELAQALEQATQRRRLRLARQAEWDDSLSSLQLRHQELASA